MATDLVVIFGRMAERAEAWNRMREFLASGHLIVPRIEFPRPAYPLSDAALATAYAWDARRWRALAVATTTAPPVVP